MTADARESFRLVFDSLVPEAEKWIRSAARKNPAKGAELLLRLAEYFVPKVSRHELTGRDGKDLLENLTDEQLEERLRALMAKATEEGRG